MQIPPNENLCAFGNPNILFQRYEDSCSLAKGISRFRDSNPHSFLGPHKKEEGFTVVRAHIPGANKAWIRTLTGHLVSMKNLFGTDVFEGKQKPDELFPHEYEIGYSLDVEKLERLMDKTAIGLIEKKYGQVTHNRFIEIIDNDHELVAQIQKELERLIDSQQIRFFSDAYQISPDITPEERWLWSEGTDLLCYERFGARIRTINGVQGVHFTVWAPKADAVSIVGSFNSWEAGAHPMTNVDKSGLWGLFIPELQEGTLYKYAIKHQGEVLDQFKTDPFALAYELRPENASIVTTVNGYNWQDQDWIEQRKLLNPKSSPISVYEVHLGSWQRDKNNVHGFLSYRELAHKLVKYVKEMGYTHIELLPIMEHACDESWGYQVTGYYAPTSRHGPPKDFMYFVDYCHQNGIGVILDWVPGHFSANTDALRLFDGTTLFEYSDPRLGHHQAWNVWVPDFVKPQVRNFLISNALFWLDKYHVDGFRVDALASMLYRNYDRGEKANKGKTWVPNANGGNEHWEAIDFIKQFNKIVHERFPGVITFAEDSSHWGGITKPLSDEDPAAFGFDLRWNIGWMGETIGKNGGFFLRDLRHKRNYSKDLARPDHYACSESHVLPISHDEVVHCKSPLLHKMHRSEWRGVRDELKFAALRLFYAYMFTYPGKKLSFMGNEFAATKEWNHKEALQWDLLEHPPHRQTQDLVKELNKLYRENPALHELDYSNEGVKWIDRSSMPYWESDSVNYIRFNSNGRSVIFICNFQYDRYQNFEVPVPKAGIYKEILNTDDIRFGGKGITNNGSIASSQTHKTSNAPHISIRLSPLSAGIFELES